ncbi:uncharacterized protein LOC111921459 [Lactuca sativa]|uniref:uncharacterized protein LOC111921459 n=1 Tax=Lactuca sativa TaxID=4236 RepID=UPI0022AF5784|nr:uncharacterized protein LOC111921459 [Lactuca sativa]
MSTLCRRHVVGIGVYPKTDTQLSFICTQRLFSALSPPKRRNRVPSFNFQRFVESKQPVVKLHLSIDCLTFHHLVLSSEITTSHHLTSLTSKKSRTSGWCTSRAEEDWEKIQNEYEKMQNEVGEGGEVNEEECLEHALGTRCGHARGVGRRPTANFGLIPNERPSTSKSSQSQPQSQSQFDAQQMQEYLQQYNASLAACIPNFQPPPFPNFLCNYNTQASSSQQFAERMEEEGEGEKEGEEEGEEEEGEDDYDNDD